jgi:transcriptional regulator with XRE-family HTH domain
LVHYVDMTTAQLRPVGRIPEWDLHDRLGKALRDSGLGVSEIAEQLGVGRETVGRWLNGRGVPKRQSLLAWSSLTGVDLKWLETGEAQTAPDRDPTPPNGVPLPRLDSNQQPSGYAFALVRAA